MHIFFFSVLVHERAKKQRHLNRADLSQKLLNWCDRRKHTSQQKDKRRVEIHYRSNKSEVPESAELGSSHNSPQHPAGTRENSTRARSGRTTPSYFISSPRTQWEREIMSYVLMLNTYWDSLQLFMYDKGCVCAPLFISLAVCLRLCVET